MKYLLLIMLLKHAGFFCSILILNKWLYTTKREQSMGQQPLRDLSTPNFIRLDVSMKSLT
jgi:hypothetical protein